MESKVGRIQKLSEDVINKIAAGEIIHRPANVVKELLENSIDAQSSTIQITVKGGGFQMIQIQDNGCGIRKEDLDIICERFTTSKLTCFEDLLQMRTYGFRGEALSSISHVSKLMITAKTEDELCGYKLSFSEGKPLDQPKPVAANRGTIIAVEDLFYNSSIRKKTLKTPNEEYNLIVDLVTKYALHNVNRVGISLKKFGDSNNDVCTLTGGKTIDAIKTLYGIGTSRDIIEVSIEKRGNFKFSCQAFISNSNVKMKKFRFILFTNDRLVENSFLKKGIESIYNSLLVKGVHPFVYLNLQIAYNMIDVNVHPAKNEVHFLYEEEICSLIVESINDKLTESESSRNFIAPKILPNTSFSQELEENNSTSKIQSKDNSFKGSDDELMPSCSTNKNDKSEMIFSTKHINLKNNKLCDEEQISKTKNKSASDKSHLVLPTPARKTFTPRNSVGEVTMQRASEKIRTDSKERKIDEFFGVIRDGGQAKRREIKFVSVLTLRNEVSKATDKYLQDILCNSTFVGCADEKFILVQHERQLMIIDSEQLNKELFYQMYLLDFANFPAFKLSNALKISQLAKIYLDSKEIVDTFPNEVESILMSKREMLDPYFSLKINENGELLTLPVIIEGHTMNVGFLPEFVVFLAIKTNWQCEKECFESIGRILAKFYAKPPNKFEDENDHLNWTNTFERVLYRAYKSVLCPSKDPVNQTAFNVVANLDDLYKVFERC